MADKEKTPDDITLRDVLGAILKDVAESRFTSDRYSRDMSRYYEQDDVMRLFPVPRTEISELELELKFAFSDVARQQSRIEVLERRAIHNFILYSDIIARKILGKIISIHDQAESFKNDTKWKEIKNKLRTSGFLQRMESKLYDFFYWGTKYWLSIKSPDVIQNTASTEKEKNIGFDVEKLLKSLMELLFEGSRRIEVQNDSVVKKGANSSNLDISRELIIDPIFNKDLLGDYYEGFAERVKPELSEIIFNSLQEMKFRFEFINRENGEANVYVDITANKLANLQFERLSTIRVKTTLKNYIWTELDADQRSRLIAE